MLFVVLLNGAPLPENVTETDLILFRKAQAKANQVHLFFNNNKWILSK